MRPSRQRLCALAPALSGAAQARNLRRPPLPAKPLHA